VGAAPAERWHQRLPGAWLYWSSPVIADVNGDGSNDVVVGGLNGLVYALDAAGNNLPGWPAQASGAVASSPAVGDLDGDGTSEVVVGVGTLEVGGQRGAVNIFNRDGSRRCVFLASTDHGESAVFNAPALGDVDGDGTKDVVFASFDQRIRVVNHRCEGMGSYDHADSLFSAPALSDVDGDGDQEIFIGGDASRGPVGQSHNGGTFRSLDYRAGVTHPDGHVNLVQRWSREESRETFQSAAAIGNIDGDPGLEVVTGSGAYYCRYQNQCADSNKVWAFNAEDGSSVAGWPKSVTFNTTFLSAPALGDLDGDGTTDVVVGSNHYTSTNPAGGALEAFYGNGGHRRFVAPNDLEIMASPVIADVNGTAGNEVVIGASHQVFVLDGNLGVLESGLAYNFAHKSAAVVGELGPGRFALVSAGFDTNPGRNNEGHVVALDIPAPKSLPWPMHRKNPRRAGAELTDPVPIRCDMGYRLVAADGGVFTFGNAPFFGSTGDVRLNQPIVGMSSLSPAGAYRFVARDGGIFNFGPGATFHGSTGGTRLNSSIVGMATTPSGKGYWLVAADGGIFTFGDALFLGSAGAIPLNSPIVGMAATPSGDGYWLVAADGGIFSFGKAAFFGSTGAIRLNSPIVGMAAHPGGRGYWFVAADGGIFTFGNIGFHGSAGHLRLNRPVVGMKATGTGNGYWFVADDGGIFAFGDAQFCGSTGNRRLNQPIVGMG
jgi:hypothetical protein